jgi:hypothetical protein
MSTLLDVTGNMDLLNLDHVRNLEVTSYGRGERMALKVTYANGSDDTYMVSAGRWRVLEDILLDMVAQAA